MSRNGVLPSWLYIVEKVFICACWFFGVLNHRSDYRLVDGEGIGKCRDYLVVPARQCHVHQPLSPPFKCE